MRKILLTIIIVLLLILGYVSLMNGVKVGNFQILSYKEIEEGSQNLKDKIEEVNALIDMQYPKKISELKEASNNMENAKSEYLKYTNFSSDEDILAARTEKSYTIEFLWATLGTHAREEGVNLKFEIIGSSTGANDVNDIKFTVEGSYIAITNFVYAIENDSKLDFRITNFKLLPYQKEILQATFNVRNIAIQGNTSTQTVTTTPEKEEEKKNTTNTNTTNTNNTTENTTENNVTE